MPASIALIFTAILLGVAFLGWLLASWFDELYAPPRWPSADDLRD